MTSRSDLRAAAQQALEALEGMATWVQQRPDPHPWDSWQRVGPAMEAIRAALAEPAEPVARVEEIIEDLHKINNHYRIRWTDSDEALIPLHDAIAVVEEAGRRYESPTPRKPEQEPVAWSFEARHIDGPWVAAVSLKHPGPEGVYQRKVTPLYIAPTPSKPEPLTDEEIDRVTDQQWAQNNHKPVYAAHRAYAHAVIAAYESKQFGRGNE